MCRFLKSLRFRLRTIIVLVGLLTISSSDMMLVAQESSTVQGLVFDPTGAVIPGAVVTLSDGKRS